MLEYYKYCRTELNKLTDFDTAITTLAAIVLISSWQGKMLTGRGYLVGGGPAGDPAVSSSGRSVCASRIPVRANSLPEEDTASDATQGGAPFSAEAFYYDWRSAPVQTHAVDHQGIVSDTYLALSFTGKVTASREEVTVPATLSATGSPVSTVTLKTMSYDGWYRLTGESITVGDGTTSGSVSDQMSYSYDALDYENHVRRIMGMHRRPYDLNGHSKYTTTFYGITGHLVN